MSVLGISITRNNLSAVLWESTLFSSRVAFACTVPCREAHGGPEDAGKLAEEIRKGTGSATLPPAVLSLPPSWTYLRQVELPAKDLPLAKKIHVAELEGSLPLEDEAILSDLLPSPPAHPGKYLAVAARREGVEKTVSLFAGAGFRVDRVVTDHVSILSAFLSGNALPDGLIVSTLSDIVILRTEGGAVRWARQFPSAMADSDGSLAKELRECMAVDAPSNMLLPVTLIGEAPTGLAQELAGSVRFRLPDGAGDAAPLAYGAARVFSHAKELGGFSLRTSAEGESERKRQQRRVRIACIAAGVALLSAVASLEIAQWAETRRIAAVRAQIRKEFTEAVPGAKATALEPAQIRAKVQSLRRQQKEMGIDSAGLSVSLGKISQSLPLKENIVMKEVSYESGRMRISGEAGGTQQVEKFRTALASSFGREMNVTVQESQGTARGGSIRFTILVEKGTTGRAS
ncbi:MAG: hypothetical protein HY896_13305 [Deltaproteobacteria bacterium]|nr:hypothetical protein [Deltaproteobacteria bacterium]